MTHKLFSNRWLMAVVLLLLPLVLQNFGNAWVRIADMSLLYVLLALGLNIVVGVKHHRWSAAPGFPPSNDGGLPLRGRLSHGSGDNRDRVKQPRVFQEPGCESRAGLNVGGIVRGPRNRGNRN
jgi:hypothetical protein